MNVVAHDKSKQKRYITKYVTHEKYEDKSKANDIALVFIDSPFEQTDTFNVVVMSDKDPVDEEPCSAGM